MTHLTTLLLSGLILLSTALSTLADPTPEKITPVDLWPGLAPGEQTASTGSSTTDSTGRYGPITKVQDVSRPQLFFYPCPGPALPRPTVLVFPGGGYYLLATDIEGTEIARWLNSLGYNAAVLHYRIPSQTVPAPARREPAWQDARQAMSFLRTHANAWGIDSHHLGVIGFSAGGHLAARLACALADAAWRPDFALLIYPAYLWDKSHDAPMPEVAPHAGMPPIFLMQTRDDALFDVEEYAGALRRTGVPEQCMICPEGGHGYGLRLPPDLPAHHWPDDAATWLHQQVLPSSTSTPTSVP